MRNNFIKYHGGKGRMIGKLLKLVPEHEMYIEPFLGGGSMLLNKQTSSASLCYDVNEKLINMWKALQSGSLIAGLEGIEYSEDNFLKAQAGEFSNSVNEFILYRMSRGGLKKDFAWSERKRGGLPGDVNAWNNCIKNLPTLKEKIKDVHFAHCDWSLCRDYDQNFFFVYLDPPYVHSTRTKTFYENEIGEDIHIQILEYFSSSRTKVMLSGYDNQLYRDYIGPPTYTFDVPNNSGQSKIKQRRVECIWTNYK